MERDDRAPRHHHRRRRRSHSISVLESFAMATKVNTGRADKTSRPFVVVVIVVDGARASERATWPLCKQRGACLQSGAIINWKNVIDSRSPQSPPRKAQASALRRLPKLMTAARLARCPLARRRATKPTCAARKLDTNSLRPLPLAQVALRSYKRTRLLADSPPVLVKRATNKHS